MYFIYFTASWISLWMSQRPVRTSQISLSIGISQRSVCNLQKPTLLWYLSVRTFQSSMCTSKKKNQCAPLKYWCAVLKISNAHFSSIKLRTSEISTTPFSHLCRISRDTAIISNLKISFVGNAFTGNNVGFWYWSGFRYKLDIHLSLLTTFSFLGIWVGQKAISITPSARRFLAFQRAKKIQRESYCKII